VTVAVAARAYRARFVEATRYGDWLCHPWGQPQADPCCHAWRQTAGTLPPRSGRKCL